MFVIAITTKKRFVLILIVLFLLIAVVCVGHHLPRSVTIDTVVCALDDPSVTKTVSISVKEWRFFLRPSYYEGTVTLDSVVYHDAISQGKPYDYLQGKGFFEKLGDKLKGQRYDLFVRLDVHTLAADRLHGDRIELTIRNKDDFSLLTTSEDTQAMVYVPLGK